MTASTQYESLGVVHTDAGVETTLLRGVNGELYLKRTLRGQAQAEVTAAFKSAGRRAKAASHRGFESIVDAGSDSFVVPLCAGEALEALHRAYANAGEDALPAEIVAYVVRAIVDSLAGVHELGLAGGPFDAGDVLIGLDGTVAIVGAPLRAVRAHRRGAVPTTVSDLKELGALIERLSPNAEAGRRELQPSGDLSTNGRRKRRDSSELIGKTVAERYVVKSLLGEGGMGAVYLAEQPALKRTLAIKVLHPEYAEDPEIARRFHQEALAASQLKHPHTISIIDFGESDGQLYLAMEYMDGETLHDAISRGSGLSLSRSLQILRQALKSVDEAHSQGIIHRDLKPENIFLMRVGSDSDFVKVLDFGVAKLRRPDQDDQATITMAGSVFGTPRYMAPEQSQDVELDQRADLYSLGVTLYEMLMGQPPFGSENPLSVLMAHVTQPPPRFSRLRPEIDVPEAVEAVVFKALAKDPRHRYQTAQEMADDLERLIRLVDGRSDGRDLSMLPELPQSLARAGVKDTTEALVGMKGWAGLNSLAQELVSGDLDDAVDLSEKIDGVLQPVASAEEVVAWLEHDFVSRVSAWKALQAADAAAHAAPPLFMEPLAMDRLPPPSPTDAPEAVAVPSSGVAPEISMRPSGGTKERYLEVIEDGYEPNLWEKSVDENPARLGYGLDDFLSPLTHTEASGDTSSSIVLEVVRCVGNAVMESTTVHVGSQYRLQGVSIAKVSEKFVDLSLPPGIEGQAYRLGKQKSFKGTERLEAGERVAFEHEGQSYRIRVDHAPRQVGEATGIKRPWKLWAACGGIGVGIHLAFFLFVTSLSSMGVQLTVEAPPAEEIFKDVLLKKDLPKPKIKPKKPKPKKPKPKVKRKKPKPPDPTEAKPVISDNLREKLQTRIKSRSKGAKNAAEALMNALEPADTEQPSVGDVLNTLDAVGPRSSSSAFAVAGDIGAQQPGERIRVGGGGRGVRTKGGAGKGVGKLKGRSRGRKIRGKVKVVRAMARVKGTLSRAEVLAAINKSYRKIQACYEKALQRGGKKLSGKIKLEWTIRTNGRVRSARSKLDTLGDPKVTSCILRQIKRIKFPRPKGGEVVVAFPFMFSSR